MKIASLGRAAIHALVNAKDPKQVVDNPKWGIPLNSQKPGFGKSE